MNDLEKLRVLLPHWIEHNSGHGKEFAKWAHLLSTAGDKDIAALLKKAAVSLQEAEKDLRKALDKSGGALPGHEHDHHHHNLPE